MIAKKNFGLNILPPDERDYSHDDTFGTLGAAQLPTKDFTIYDSFLYTIKWGDTITKIAKKFGFQVFEIMNANTKIVNVNKIYTGQVITIPARKNFIINQLDLDFCTGFATVELQNAIWGIQNDPLYQMSKIKEIQGSYTGYGASLRDAVQSVVKYGSLPLSQAPYAHDGSIQSKSRDFLANWKNYPTGLDAIALKEKDLSFFTVDGPNDTFDNIRSILWTHLQERRGVTFGLYWHDAWTEVRNGIIPDTMPNDAEGGGHDIALIGQKTINGEVRIVGQQTWGPNAGDHGFYYFPRSIINASFREGYGAYTFSNQDASGYTTSVGFITTIATIINKLLGKI